MRRTWPALVYVGLIAVGIPWYWESDNYSIIFGMPAWLGIAIAASFAASIFTAWLLRRPWPTESASEHDN